MEAISDAYHILISMEVLLFLKIIIDDLAIYFFEVVLSNCKFINFKPRIIWEQQILKGKNVYKVSKHLDKLDFYLN